MTPGGVGPPRDASDELGRLARGEVRADALLEEYLGRLRRSQLHCNGAAEILEAAARAAASGALSGPLAGLPFSMKETIAVGGREITAGSRRMPAQRCSADAAVLARLRAAGAVLVARGNVPELAMAGETDNLRFGRSNNPLDPALTCGGSSGGDAVLVASGAAAFGVGTDILGSIRIPAAFCGLVGFRPASDAVDTTGAWPDVQGECASWLSAGPLARSVRDARLVYKVMSATQLPPRPGLAGRFWMPEPSALRIGDAPISAALAAARSHLLAAGYLAAKAPLEGLRPVYRDMMRVLATELGPQLKACLTDASGHRFSVGREWLGRLLGRPPTIYRELLRQLTFVPLLRTGPRGLAATVARLRAARERVRSILGKDGLLLLPSLGLLAPLHGGMNRRSLRPGYNGLLAPTMFCNGIDLPAISLPAPAHCAPHDRRVPAITLACAPGAEGLLFDAAAYLEKKLNKAA
jgi:Asp-tRNA(Asn)/Glu-tRNA(Gln) amidotransferase A subunit family amidase